MMVKRRSYKSFNFVEVFLNIIKNKISAFFITADSKSKTPVQQMDAKKIPVTGKLNFFISFYNLTEEKNIFIKIRIRTPDKAYSSEAKLDDLKRKLQHITEMHFTLNSALFKTAGDISAKITLFEKDELTSKETILDFSHTYCRFLGRAKNHEQ